MYKNNWAHVILTKHSRSEVAAVRRMKKYVSSLSVEFNSFIITLIQKCLSYRLKAITKRRQNIVFLFMKKKNIETVLKEEKTRNIK